MYIYMCIYTHTYIYRGYPDTYTYITYIHIYAYTTYITSIHLDHIYIYMCTYVHMHINTYVHIFIYIYIYVFTDEIYSTPIADSSLIRLNESVDCPRKLPK